MIVTLTWAHIVGLIALCATVVPAAYWMGRLDRRVGALEEANIAAGIQRTEMQKDMNEVREKVSWMHGRMKNGGEH